ncbi:MAG: ABC transporter substrate-binding protein, partial [Eubacteriales bacterium]
DSQLIDTGDVVFSIKTILRAKDVNGIYTAAFSNIQGAAAYISGETDDLEGLSTNGNIITIQLEEQSPTLIQVLAQFVILPEHCFENSDLANILKDNYWKIPVVSGMYQVQNVDIDKTVTLGRNPYYGDTPPQIDQVVLHVDYKFTTLDYYSTNNITEIINYRSIRYMEEYKIDILFYRYLMFNIKGIDGNYNEAMDDPYVRQAIAYAIDRETLLSDIYLDSGTLIDSGVARSNQAYDGVTIDYNVEKAKELLAMSDYDLDRPLRLTYYYLDATSQTFMEKVAEDLEEVGFTVDLFRCETTTLYDGREYDLALKGLSAFNLNEWYIEYTSSSPQLNKLFGGVNEFEVPVKQLILQLEGDERDAILLELQALEHETMYKIPLFTLGQVLYINDERVNLPTNCTFGNTWYKYDVDFEYWSIKTE